MIYSDFFSDKSKQRIAVLIDPDKQTLQESTKKAAIINQIGADMIFVGGSLVTNSVSQTVQAIKSASDKPVILFPGAVSQFCTQADALILPCLISGRNPQYLIGSFVEAAGMIKKSGIETVSTAYILIDGGKRTAVEYISNTTPLPADKPDLAAATAMAGEMLGMKAVYLEAGSGALNPVSKQIISTVKQSVDIPVIVGGGIKTAQQMQTAFDAGASVVVIGTAFENNNTFLNFF